MFAAAIGEENEGYAVVLEVGEGLVGAGEGIGASNEDAVDTGDCQYTEEVIWVIWCLLECEGKLWYALRRGRRGLQTATSLYPIGVAGHEACRMQRRYDGAHCSCPKTPAPKIYQ